jgi:hypothetical protein
VEEGSYAAEDDEHFLLRPTTSWRNGEGMNTYPNLLPYSSDIASELTREELAELLDNSPRIVNAKELEDRCPAVSNMYPEVRCTRVIGHAGPHFGTNDSFFLNVNE